MAGGRRMNGYVCSFVVQHLDVERVSYYDVRAMKETRSESRRVVRGGRNPLSEIPSGAAD